MCGLVGIVNSSKVGLHNTDTTIFRQLLIANAVRGIDGTGIMSVSTEGKTDYRKIGDNPFALLDATDPADKKISIGRWAFDPTNDWHALFGHNRYATTGGSGTDSAHPFTHGKITLIHNGTLKKDSKFDIEECPVDSESLCKHMDRVGVEQALKDTSGAVAMIAVDSEAKMVYIYRNRERPLFLASNKANTRMALASEKEMLEWILNRVPGNSDLIVEELKPYQLLSFPIGDLPKAKFTEVHTMSGYNWEDGWSDYFDKRDKEEPGWDVRKSQVVEKFNKNDWIKPKVQQSSYINSSVISGVKEGQRIIFTLTNYQQDVHGKDIHKYIVDGFFEDSPEVILRYSIKGEENLNKHMKSSYLSGHVRRLLFYTGNDRKPGKAYDIAWMDNVIPYEGKEHYGHQAAVS